MDSSIIAVRVANGTFVPILETSGAKRRRLVLTTIRDNQTSVQIDLYRGADESMEAAEYVGTLMVESIKEAPAGEADVALLLGVDESGNLNATATDKQSGEYQSLSVELESLDAESTYDVPDFELSEEELSLEEVSAGEDGLELEDADAGLDDVTLEEDLTFDIEAEPMSDTLAAPDSDEPGELDESVSGDELAGLESFSEESISLDESLSDESLGEITQSDDQIESVSDEETEAGFSTLPDLKEGMIEAELGEEDFTFDEAGEAFELGDGTASELTGPAEADDDLGFGDEELEESDLTAEEEVPEELSLEETSFETESLETESLEAEGLDTEFDAVEFEAADFASEPDENLFDDSPFAESDESVGLDEPAAVADGIDNSLLDEETPLDDETPSFGEEPPREEVAAFGENAAVLAPRRSNAIIYAGYLILSLAALGVLTYLVFRLLEGPPAPSLQASLPFAFLIPRRWLRRRKGTDS